jgi:hypothetical protein
MSRSRKEEGGPLSVASTRPRPPSPRKLHIPSPKNHNDRNETA